MFSKFKKTVAAGLMGLILTYSGCKEELNIVKIPSSNLERKLGQANNVTGYSGRKPYAPSIKDETVKVKQESDSDSKSICNLKPQEFKFCGNMSKEKGCGGEGPEFDVGADVFFTFYIGIDQLFGEVYLIHKVLKDDKRFHTKTNRTKKFLNDKGYNFIGEFDMGFTSKPGKYELVVDLLAEKSQCRYKLVKTFELFEKPEDEGGWDPPPGWKPPKD